MSNVSSGEQYFKILREFSNRLFSLVRVRSAVIQSHGSAIIDSSSVEVLKNDAVFGNDQQMLTLREIVISACARHTIATGDAKHIVGFVSNLLSECARVLPVAWRADVVADDVDAIVHYSQSHMRMCESIDEIEECVAMTSGTRLAAIVRTAYDLCGQRGRLTIESGHSDDFVVEAKYGYSFPICAPAQFVGRSGVRAQCKARVCTIDGNIERVSEIHQLLERASETHEPMVIFCRNIVNEVYTTLHVNYLRKTLDVVPIALPDDLSLINALNDIAVVCGCEVVSALKGQLISTIKYDSLPIVDIIEHSVGSTMIQNDKTIGAVICHLNNLRERMQATEPALHETLLSRMRSLTSCRAIIQTPDVDRYTKNSNAGQIEQCAQVFRNVIARGFVTIDDDLVNRINQRQLKSVLQSMLGQQLPTSVLVGMATHGVECVGQLVRSNAIVSALIDKC